MKQISTFFNTILIGILVLITLSVGLPVLRTQAAQLAEAPTATPTDQPGSSSKSVCDSSRSIQVSGTAVINVIPDRALIQLGVQSNGSTPAAVEGVNSAAIQAVINVVRSLGVESRDIATDWYVIEPVYENYDSLFIKGYRIHNMVAITLRDVSQTSKVVAAALQAGANQVINVDLYTSELRKYRDQARELAMKAAAEKAQALTGAAGAETGCVMNISENSSSAYNGWWYGRNQTQNQWTQNVIQNSTPAGGSSAGGEADTFSLGQISVRAEVGVTFSLK